MCGNPHKGKIDGQYGKENMAFLWGKKVNLRIKLKQRESAALSFRPTSQYIKFGLDPKGGRESLRSLRSSKCGVGAHGWLFRLSG